MGVTCAAVVGKGNNPLYVRTFGVSEDEALRFHFVVHTSLDVVEERLQTRKGSPPGVGGLSDLYLGLLCPTDDYKVYGYITNTNAKLFLVTDDIDIKEADIKSFFRRMDTAITSASFDREVVQLARSYQ